MTDNEYLEVIQKAIKEEDKRVIRIIKNLLDEHYVPDDKEVFVIEVAITKLRWSEHKAEIKYSYYIRESKEETQKLIEFVEDLGVETRVFSGISKNKIKEIERINYGNS